MEHSLIESMNANATVEGAFESVNARTTVEEWRFSAA